MSRLSCATWTVAGIALVADILLPVSAASVEKFSKDTPFPSTGPYNKAQPASHPNRLNLSRNFIYMTPELGQYLHEHAAGRTGKVP